MRLKKTDTPTPAVAGGEEIYRHPIALGCIAIVKSYSRIAKAEQPETAQFESQMRNDFGRLIDEPALSLVLAWIEREREFAQEFARFVIERDPLLDADLSINHVNPPGLAEER